MTRKVIIAIAAVVATSTIVSTAASAYDYRQGRIDAREYHQAKRIDLGRRAGLLTRHEADRLRAEQDRIYRLERWAKSDGVITRNEARRIDHAQDQARRHIKRETYDGQTSWRFWR